MLSLRSLATALSLATLATAGCSFEGPSDDPEDGFVVPDGKEDNFLSDAAREFVIEGRSFVTVEEGEGLERAMELIRLKHVAIAWFLNSLLIEDEGPNGEVTGFGAMVKTGRHEDLSITQINARSFEFTFKQLIAGKKDLLTRLPLEDGVLTFEIGKPTNEEMAELFINKEWYRKDPWKNWKPETQPASKKETLVLTIKREATTPDAWWDYNALMDDDVVDIDVHFGWDFHDAFHLKNSRALYSWLTNVKGFDTPVGSFDEYESSDVLTKVIEADGRDVTFEIRIFWPKPDSPTDPDTDAGGIQLEENFRESLRTVDVIAFEGHSGPFFGFPLANWKKTDEGDFDDSEMGSAEMPSDKYQIVFGEGCDTFMIGPAFLDNPAKNGVNIDIVTTTAMSDSESSPLHNFLSRMMEKDSQGRHRPRAIRSMLSELDPAAMYGVHGVSDNPHLHPYAKTENFCERCSSNTDCGGAGNNCIKIGDSGKRCASSCTAHDGCPSGFSCRKVASESNQTIFAKMCVPSDLVCE